MTDLRVIGIDPGPVPGLVVLDLNDFPQGPNRAEGRWLDTVEVLQCSSGLLVELLEALLISSDTPAVVQVERFVTGRRAGRSASAHAGAATRDLVGEIEGAVNRFSRPSALAPREDRCVQRSAAAVKPWATDLRLQKADLWRCTAGMRHARDAARHALFAACHDGGLTDPLSKEFKL